MADEDYFRYFARIISVVDTLELSIRSFIISTTHEKIFGQLADLRNIFTEFFDEIFIFKIIEEIVLLRYG